MGYLFRLFSDFQFSLILDFGGIVNGFVFIIEKHSEDKIKELKIGMNALIAENNNLKQELDKKQKLITDMQEKA